MRKELQIICINLLAYPYVLVYSECV